MHRDNKRSVRVSGLVISSNYLCVSVCVCVESGWKQDGEGSTVVLEGEEPNTGLDFPSSRRLFTLMGGRWITKEPLELTSTSFWRARNEVESDGKPWFICLGEGERGGGGCRPNSRLNKVYHVESRERVYRNELSRVVEIVWGFMGRQRVVSEAAEVGGVEESLSSLTDDWADGVRVECCCESLFKFYASFHLRIHKLSNKNSYRRKEKSKYKNSQGERQQHPKHNISD